MQSSIAHHLSVARNKGESPINIEEIIRAWKSEEEAVEPHLPASPVGEVLNEEELLEVEGGVAHCDILTCWYYDLTWSD
jgi:hypothetical protein